MKTRLKILLVGGNGYIGGEILAKFHDNKIYIFDKKLQRKNINPNHVFIKGDLNKKNDYSKLPKYVDVVIFLAGIKGGPDSVLLNKANKYLVKNFIILKSFLKYSLNIKYKKLIFLSTEHVYQDKYKKKMKKELLPINFYGFSKLICEKYLYNFYMEKKICINIIRFPRVVSLQNNNLISDLLKQCLKKRITINNSDQDFNFIFINDLIDALKKCILFKGSFEIFDIFNNDKPVSLISIVKKISKKINLRIKIKKRSIKTKIQHNPQNLFISNNYAKKKLNWKPKYSQQKMINDIIYFNNEY